MKDFFLNRQIKRIEREANDDFLQILSFGAGCYPTKELYQLLRRLDAETQRLAYYRRLLFLMGSTITLWIALGYLSQNVNFIPGFYLALALIPLSITLFVGGLIVLKQKFRAIMNAHIVEKIIVEELERRRKDASIF